MRLENKVALVTGGGSGIGRATSVLFAREGARIVVSDVVEAAARQTADEVGAVGGEAVVVTGDVSRTDDAKAMVDAALDAYGKLDVLVNSAGVTGRNAAGPEASPEEVWDRVIEVNLKGTYLVSWHAVPEMKRGGGGSIVNLASIIAVVGYTSEIPAVTDGFNPYPASKGGVLQFTPQPGHRVRPRQHPGELHLPGLHRDEHDGLSHRQPGDLRGPDQEAPVGQVRAGPRT